MKLSSIISSIGPKLGEIILSVLAVTKIVFAYLSTRQQSKYNDEQKKKDKEYYDKMTDVVDNGTIDDLIDLKKVSLILTSVMFMSGCVNNIVVQPTQSWEGHYMTVEQFKNNTENISLQKNQSIWVLSNTTLKRVLDNNKGN